jgi:hypothetical protein
MLLLIIIKFTSTFESVKRILKTLFFVKTTSSNFCISSTKFWISVHTRNESSIFRNRVVFLINRFLSKLKNKESNIPFMTCLWLKFYTYVLQSMTFLFLWTNQQILYPFKVYCGSIYFWEQIFLKKFQKIKSNLHKAAETSML